MRQIAKESVKMLESNSNSIISSFNACSDATDSYQVFAAVLKSCAAVSAINWGRAIHCNATKLGHISCQFVSKALLNMYAKCRVLNDCKRLFNEMGRGGNDPVVSNIMLSGFAGSKGYELDGLKLFREMCSVDGVRTSSISVAIVLPVCVRLRDVNFGKSVHCYAIKSGLEGYTLVGNALVSMYAKCGLVYSDAYAAFDGIVDKDVVSWNAIIAGFSENKMMENAFRLFGSMPKASVKPNYATIVNVLPVCASLDTDSAYWLGKQIHCYALRQNELMAEVSVSNAFVSFYLRVGKEEQAEKLFRRMGLRDLVSWNAIISGYASNGKWPEALDLFRELMYSEMVAPDSITLLGVLPACMHLKDFEAGRQIHSYVLRHPLLWDNTSVANALLSLYAKCEDIETAYQTFLKISSRDLISWNSMLDAFAEGGHHTRFLKLLERMFREGVRPDYITILSTVRFSVSTLRLDKVKENHGYLIRHGFLFSDGEPTIGNALLDAYARCGNIEYASGVFQSLSEKCNLVTFNSMISSYVNNGLCDDGFMIFNRMPSRDITTWNLMVRAHAENDCPDQTLGLFHELQAQGMKPDARTIMSILPSCTQIASVHLLKQCHGYVIRSCFDDIHLEGALLDVYAKCGSINYACKIFESKLYKDLVLFTAMICGYAMHGMGEEALGIFHNMLELGIKPDHVVITAVLSACSHAGLVDEGLNIFYEIEKLQGMTPTMEQYSCVVDILARGGRINDAYSLVTNMPTEPNASVWGSLLGACKTHNEVELGRVVADHLFKMEANNIGNYVVMSNLYAAEARWDGVMELRKLMRTRDLKKPAGCSWIEVESRNNFFVAGDSSHHQRSNIYSMLSVLDRQIKEPLRISQQSILQLLECDK